MKLIQKILNQEIAIARSCDSGAKHSATSQARFGRNYIQLELPRHTRIAASRHNSSMVTAAASNVSAERSEVLIDNSSIAPATNVFDSNAIGMRLKSKILLRSADAIRDNYPSLCAHLLVNKKIKSGVFLYTPSSSQIYMSLVDGLKQTDRRLRDTSKSTVRVSQLQSTSGIVGDNSVLMDNNKSKPVYRRLVSLMTQPSISIYKIYTRNLNLSEHSFNGLGAVKQLEALKKERSKLIDRRQNVDGVESGLLLATRFVSSGPNDNLLNAVSFVKKANASRSARKTHGRSRNNYDSLAKLAPTDWINLVVGYYLRH